MDKLINDILNLHNQGAKVEEINQFILNTFSKLGDDSIVLRNIEDFKDYVVNYIVKHPDDKNNDILYELCSNFNTFMCNNSNHEVAYYRLKAIDFEREIHSMYQLTLKNYKPIDLYNDIILTEEFGYFSKDEISKFKEIYDYYYYGYYGYYRQKKLNINSYVSYDNLLKICTDSTYFSIPVLKKYLEMPSRAFYNNIKKYEDKFNKEQLQILFTLASQYKKFESLYIVDTYKIRLKEFLTLNNEDEMVNHMISIKYRPIEFLDDINDAEEYGGFSKKEISKLKSAYNIYISMYPTKADLDVFLNWIKTNYSLERLGSYMMDNLNVEAEKLSNSVSKYKNTYSKEDAKLLHDVIFIYDRCYNGEEEKESFFRLQKILECKNEQEAIDNLSGVKRFRRLDVEKFSDEIDKAEESNYFTNDELKKLRKIYRAYKDHNLNIKFKNVADSLLMYVKIYNPDIWSIARFLSQNKGVDPKTFFDAIKNFQHMYDGKYDENDRQLLYDIAYEYYKFHIYNINVMDILNMENDLDAINYMISKKYTISGLEYDRARIEKSGNFSDDELEKLNRIFDLYLKNYNFLTEETVSKQKLDDFLNWIKNNYNIRKIGDYIEYNLGVSRKTFYNSIMRKQNLYTAEDRELLFDAAYDYNRFYVDGKLKNSFFKMQQLLSLKNETDIFNYLLFQNYTPIKLSDDIIRLTRSKYFSDKQIAHLKNIYVMYNNIYPALFEQITDKRSKDNLGKKINYEQEIPLPYAREVVEKYLGSGALNVDDYISEVKMKRIDFKRCLKILEYFNDPLYDEYKKINREKYYQALVADCKKICFLLKNGIKLANGKIREFDIIDYYKVTSLSFEEIEAIIVSHLSEDDIIAYQNFMSKYRRTTYLVPEQIYQTKQILGVQFDENNKPIEGTGRVIEQQEKANIINYMKSQHLPMTLSVYNAAFRRWQNGHLNMPTQFNPDEMTSIDDIHTR